MAVVDAVKEFEGEPVGTPLKKIAPNCKKSLPSDQHLIH
jgi:hypothetical protein